MIFLPIIIFNLFMHKKVAITIHTNMFPLKKNKTYKHEIGHHSSITSITSEIDKPLLYKSR